MHISTQVALNEVVVLNNEYTKWRFSRTKVLTRQKKHPKIQRGVKIQREEKTAILKLNSWFL